jgi:hypothetical protein
MKTFNDTTGRTWTLTLNLGTAMAVKAKLDVDLLQPEAGDPPLLTRLGTDEMLLGEVLCAMLEGQFEAQKVTDEDVRASFDGETLLAAQTAFYEELIEFFQSRGRNDRAKAVAKQMALIEEAVTAAETRIDALDIDATIRGAMSGESPEASDSAPANSDD